MQLFQKAAQLPQPTQPNGTKTQAGPALMLKSLGLPVEELQTLAAQLPEFLVQVKSYLHSVDMRLSAIEDTQREILKAMQEGSNAVPELPALLSGGKE